MLLLLKIFLVPTIIYLVSIAGRRWGPHISGFLSGSPSIVAPIILIIELDKGSDFAIFSANGALCGVSSLALFCFSYAWCSTRFGITRSLIISVSVFLLSTFIFLNAPLSPHLVFIFDCLLITNTVRRLPEVMFVHEGYQVPNREIAYRMVAAALLVVTLTTFSSLIGSRLSGLLAPFPIAGTILSGFTHYYYGNKATVKLLRGFMKGLFGMASFAYSLIVLTPLIGFISAFFMGLILSLVIGFVLTKYLSHLL